MAYRNIGPEDGWSDPVYVDDWGNVVPLEVVLEERRQQDIVDRVKAELKEEAKEEARKKAMPHVVYESEELRKQCEAEMAKVEKRRKPKVQPQPREPSDSDFPYWQGVNLIIQTYLQRNGLVVVKKEKYEQICEERKKLLHEKSVREESIRRYGQ